MIFLERNQTPTHITNAIGYDAEQLRRIIVAYFWHSHRCLLHPGDYRRRYYAVLGQADEDIGGVQRITKIVLNYDTVADIDHGFSDAVKEVDDTLESRSLKIIERPWILCRRFDLGYVSG